MQTEQQTLSRSIQMGWAAGALGIASYVGITMIYLLYFLTQVLDISPVWAGLALLVPRIWDAITDPVMGAISDRTKTRIGRRRPFILIGGPLFGLAFAAIFFAPVNTP
ncbi:MAG: MFS transporter, partial [Gammaproteobacteria bacterium]|nr:MFS transporter [Gammaproteobacteria bacterium]